MAKIHVANNQLSNKIQYCLLQIQNNLSITTSYMVPLEESIMLFLKEVRVTLCMVGILAPFSLFAQINILKRKLKILSVFSIRGDRIKNFSNLIFFMFNFIFQVSYKNVFFGSQIKTQLHFF